MSLNSKFDKFSENVSSKISLIENNYQSLSQKIDTLAQEKGTAQCCWGQHAQTDLK